MLDHVLLSNRSNSFPINPDIGTAITLLWVRSNPFWTNPNITMVFFLFFVGVSVLQDSSPHPKCLGFAPSPGLASGPRAPRHAADLAPIRRFALRAGWRPNLQEGLSGRILQGLENVQINGIIMGLYLSIVNGII